MQPKRRLISGRYHTGSTAHLVTIDWPEAMRIFPSGLSLPDAIASRHSGKSMCAFVTAMVGRISNPLSRNFPYASVIMCPKGSIEDTFLGSVQLLKGWCREGVIKSARKECETNGGFES